MKPHTEGAHKVSRGFIHTNIHTYTQFSPFSYIYGGCSTKPPYGEALQSPYWQGLHKAHSYPHKYIHMHILVFFSKDQGASQRPNRGGPCKALKGFIKSSHRGLHKDPGIFVQTGIYTFQSFFLQIWVLLHKSPDIRDFTHPHGICEAPIWRGFIHADILQIWWCFTKPPHRRLCKVPKQRESSYGGLYKIL